jgi:hypothetical protein
MPDSISQSTIMNIDVRMVFNAFPFAKDYNG